MHKKLTAVRLQTRGCFVMLKGVNTMNKELILKLAQTHDSFYLYDGKQMQERIAQAKQDLLNLAEQIRKINEAESQE
jgi:hypothetical protein